MTFSCLTLHDKRVRVGCESGTIARSMGEASLETPRHNDGIANFGNVNLQHALTPPTPYLYRGRQGELICVWGARPL